LIDWITLALGLFAYRLELGKVTAVIVNSEQAVSCRAQKSQFALDTDQDPVCVEQPEEECPQAVRARFFDLRRKYQKPTGSATEADSLSLLSSNAQLATHLAASISISASCDAAR